VYKLRDDLAIIQTVDFFTPIVDDPYTFGQVAAANSLSDVYAMGGRALTAMNIICFPVKTLDISILHDVLRGGLDKMIEAGVTLVGGHSVEDDEFKYGLAVTGLIHPDRVLLNRGAKAGDRLILTKALGTGIVSTAVKVGSADEALVERSIRSMSTLNRRSAELMVETPGVHACTDVTGFGLLGHACEMVEGSDVGLHVFASAIPVFTGIRELVEGEIIPGGLLRNREYRKPMVDVEPGVPAWIAEVLYDPQTSGGLLIALAASEAEGLLKRLHEAGIDDAAIVGEFVTEPRGRIRLKAEP
jgi:selenide,water dikinase